MSDTDRLPLFALAAHAAGDFLLQPNWVAEQKLDSPVVRGAHVAVYTATFAPIALASSWTHRQAATFLATIASTHFAIDSRRWSELVPGWNGDIPIWFDQALHVVAVAAAVARAEQAGGDQR